VVEQEKFIYLKYSKLSGQLPKLQLVCSDVIH